jgi:hypothetical protein
MRRAAACAALALLLSAGCGRAPSDPLFPLEAGRRWSYQVTTAYDDDRAEGFSERVEVRAQGPVQFKGATAWKRISSSGVAYWLRQDASGILRVATQGPLDPEPRTDPEGRYVLKQPHAVGTEWDADTTAYVLRRRNEFPPELRHLARYRTLPMKYRIAQVDQPLETRAGRFTGCLRVDGTGEIHLYVDELFAYRGVPFTTREWYCPAVGLVRLERVEHSPTKFIAGGTLSMDLLAYE